jgi:RNA polymerase sigma-70 factor (sigma-E family)
MPMDPAHEREFEDFVLERGTALLRTAYLLTGDLGDAEDILQTALTRTARHWRRASVQYPEAYVRRALVNLTRDRWRLRARRPEELVAAAPEAGGRDEQARVDLCDALVRALCALPKRQRTVLVLRYYADLSESEVAATLDCSLGSVKSNASRGLSRLRTLLANPHSDLVLRSIV